MYKFSFISLFLTLFLLLNSCTSDIKNRGLLQVIALYGGEITPKIDTSEEKRKTFEVDFEGKSQLFSTDKIPIISSNVAMMLYTNLTKEERKEYTHIICHITRDNKTYSNEYATKNLKFTSQALIVVGDVVELFKEHKYNQLYALCDTHITNNFTPETLNEAIEKKYTQDSLFYYTRGFNIFTNQKNNENWLKIYGLTKQAKKHQLLDLVFKKEINHKKPIIGINIKKIN